MPGRKIAAAFSPSIKGASGLGAWSGPALALCDGPVRPYRVPLARPGSWRGAKSEMQRAVARVIPRHIFDKNIS